jgi:hypothetical protein
MLFQTSCPQDPHFGDKKCTGALTWKGEVRMTETCSELSELQDALTLDKQRKRKRLFTYEIDTTTRCCSKMHAGFTSW